MPDPISISVVPGEAAIVAVSQIVQSIITFNTTLYNNATPEKRAELANKLIDSNLRALDFWDRLLTFLHVPKAT